MFVRETPPIVGTTTMVTVAFVLPGTVPRLHVTTPADCVQLPCEVFAETNVTPGGRTFVTVTAVAVEGPTLVMLSAYVRLAPTATGSGESVMLIDRSFCNSTSKGLLRPLWPPASSARRITLVAGACTAILPV